MRITQQILHQQALDGVQRHTERLLEKQLEVATGKRWLRASDDPAAASQSLVSRARQDALDGFEATLVAAKDRLNAGAAALQSLSGLLAEAKSVSVAAHNPALTDQDRLALAEQIDGILSQALEIANQRDGFGYLFGGTSTKTPYGTTENGVVYQGNGEAPTVPIGDALAVATSAAGPTVFAKMARAVSAFFGGGTGAAPGTGTDSALDRSKLLVLHGTTTLGDGALGGGDSVSGIRPSASSAALDTVIGAAGTHVLQVDSANGTISLNGGPAVAFTGSETDLAVADGNGGVVRVDVSSLTPGFQGSVSIASTGFLSTDGGATKTAIDFSANQVIVDSATKATTNVDSRAIVRAGTEVVDHAGTSNLFQALRGLRDDLRDYANLSPEVRKHSLEARGREIDRNFENTLLTIATLGSRARIAENAGERIGAAKDHIASVISNLEDADLSKSIVGLNQSLTALEAAQQAGARLLQLNVLAFLG